MFNLRDGDNLPVIGKFSATHKSNGVTLLCYGPRDLGEAKAGVPQVAFALQESDNMILDQDKLVLFLNAAVSASHGDFAPLNKLCPHQPKVGTCGIR